MRIGQAARQAMAELRAIRQAAKVSGGRDALIARARHDLDLDEVDTARLDALESRLAAAEARGAELDALNERSAATDEHLRRLDAGTQARLARVDRAIGRAELARRVDEVTTWVRAAHLADTPRISVIMATFNRCDLIARAVTSVLGQAYHRWELVVVDDGSTDGTQALLEALSLEDQRVVVVTQPHGGVSSARNAGLTRANGEIICYLDDDNVMEPLWLKAVAWAFERHPDTRLAYGARIMDVEDAGPESLPYLQFADFDRRRLEDSNYIDLGVVAHRSDLPEARFDESLRAMVDWELLLRLTKEGPPLQIPVVASIYHTSAPNRISRSADPALDGARILARLQAGRPLRVLSYNSLFPLVPETYMPDEMKALTDNGAVLAWCTDKWSPSPVTVPEKTFTDLEQAVREFEPDVLFVYWATFADVRLDVLTRTGKPFAVRVHSFDFDLDAIRRVQAHPLCVGIWAYPHHVNLIGRAHPLVPLLTTGSSFPEPAAERTVVQTACAGLPKKDWPTLVAAFAKLAVEGVDCRIVVGVTDRFESEPDRIRQLIADAGAPVKLSVDVPHDQMIALLARTAAVVYTMVPVGPFGMPRSVVEGMYAGTSVILPARPESFLVAGPDCRTYVYPDDIVHHVHEILSGGPMVQEERRGNRAYAQSHYADPGLASAFATQLRDAVARFESR